MGKHIDPVGLPTKADLLRELRENGADDSALAIIREYQQNLFGMDYIWRYPISQGTAAGGFILPVREGILWIPYDEMLREDGELLLLEDAELLTAEACGYLEEDMHSYASALCDVLKEAGVIAKTIEKQKEKAQHDA